MVNFSKALELAKNGKKIARSGWGDNMFIYYCSCELPYPPLKNGETWKSGAFKETKLLIVKTIHGNLIPYQPNNSDVLAGDWKVLL